MSPLGGGKVCILVVRVGDTVAVGDAGDKGLTSGPTWTGLGCVWLASCSGFVSDD